MKLLSKKVCVEALDRLRAAYPEAACALFHGSAFELLVAVVLSAQTTDKSVNAVSGELFGTYPDAAALAGAEEADLQRILKRIGLYKTKSKNIKALARRLCEAFGGAVPDSFTDLVSLPGVGRKSANVVLSVAFGRQRIAVDTHVFRVANRIGFCREDDVLKTELALMKRLPEARWSEAHHSLIFHGRQRCHARKPDCEDCALNGLCRGKPWTNGN
ncbi:MAG: endonuclease III [Clostridiales Family XIII bacterium]|nr:endonuclease III [Clostridiales Family XIII bacterium]